MDLQGFIGEIKELSAKLGTEVGSASLPADADVVSVGFDKELSGEFGAGKWTAGLGVEAGIRVLNDASDVDPAAIVGLEGIDSASTDPRPVIAFDPQKAWLRYDLAGVAKAGSKANSGRAAIVVSGKGRASVGAYLPADRSSTMAAAIRAHAAAFPSVFEAQDVRGLAVDSAAYLVAGGELAASVTLSWADLFTGPIAQLASDAIGDTPIVFDAKASASVTFSLTFSDAFRVVFAGREAGVVRLAVNRTTSTAYGIKAAAELSVGFKNPEQVREVLSSFSAQLLAPRALLRQAQAELDLLIKLYDGALEDIELMLGDAATELDAVLQRLGLHRALARLNALQKMVDDLADLEDLDARAAALAERLDNALSLDEASVVLERILALPDRIKTEIKSKLDDVLAAIGLRPMLAEAQAASAKLLARLDAIEGSILEVATKRVTLGIEYEYKRLATDGRLFEADLDTAHERFSEYHAAALGLDLDPLLDAVTRPGSGVALRVFLHRNTLVRSWSVGLSLGQLGSNWTGGSTWVATRRLIPVADPVRPIIEQRSASLKGYRAYSDRYFGGRKALHRGDLSAEFETDDQSRGVWRYALSLQYEREIAQADRGWLRAQLDHAAVWGLVASDESVPLADRLAREYGADAQRVRASCSLVIGNGAFVRGLLGRLAALTTDDAVESVSAALPYWDSYPIRRAVASRVEHYRSLTAMLLALGPGQSVPMEAVASAAFSTLRQHDLKLARKEGKAVKIGVASPQSLAYVAHQNLNVQKGLGQIRKAARDLDRVMRTADDSRESRRLIEEALRAWDGLWDDGFSLRWFGRLLLLQAKRVSAPSDAVAVRLRLQIGEGEARREIVVSPITAFA